MPLMGMQIQPKQIVGNAMHLQFYACDTDACWTLQPLEILYILLLLLEVLLLNAHISVPTPPN